MEKRNIRVVTKMKIFLLFILLCSIVKANDDFEKFFSDSVHFQLSYLGYDEFDEKYEGSKQLASVNTLDEEQYKCILPEIELNVRLITVFFL